MIRHLFLAGALLGLPIAGQNLPDGPGKDAFSSVCSACHALDLATAQKKSKDGWQATVDSMAAKGASASKEQFAAIVTYLAAHFGPDDTASLNAAATVMPEGAGKQIILRECTACH